MLIEPSSRPCYQRIVRWLPLCSLLVLGGCPGRGGMGGGGGGECFVDQECISGEICARDDLCWPEADVRFVKVTWTVRGMTASQTSCASHPDLHIRFDGNVSDDLGFAPVPCDIGMFIVDRLPRPFTRVELSVDNGGPGNVTSINAAGMATLDLPF